MKKYQPCFENQFHEYADNQSSVLNHSKTGISDKFESKLQSFKTAQLNHLTTNLWNDIFYDNTVYTGSAGLAFYYLTCANINKNENEQDTILKSALNYIDIKNRKGRRISFLCGDAGPLTIAAVISFKLGIKHQHNLPDYRSIVKRLMDLVSLLPESPDEILYGKSGYLYALLFVNKHITGNEVIPSDHIEKVTTSILYSGKQYSSKMKSDSPLLWKWHDKIYFGAAHGMAGILFMLLQAHTYITDSDLETLVKPTVDWLLKKMYPSGNFPSSHGSGSGDRLVQWCHGAPGFVPLLISAAKVFNDDNYMNIAKKCGDVVWERGLCTKGFSLCHGVSGNAFAFLQLYQATKNPLHLYRACCFMEWCAVERRGTELKPPDRPASLFEGLVGRLYLAESLTSPMEADFAGFCL